MKLRHRIIPILLNDKDGLVKTRAFSNPVYIGDPINTVRIFNEKFADELLILDIGRSRNNLGPDFDLVRKITAECFMPLGYGGGIRNLEDAKELFALGIEKVILQTAAISDQGVVSKIANFTGSQSISVSIDVKNDENNVPRVYHAATRKYLDISLGNFMKIVEDNGAGEILLTSVNREGSMSGFDLKLIESVRGMTSIPLVVNGGAGSVKDLVQAINAGADAVAAGSMFVFYGSRRGVLINYPAYGEFELKLGIKDGA